MKILKYILLLLLVPSVGFGANLYVNGDTVSGHMGPTTLSAYAPGGDGSEDGSLDHPYDTIAEAVTAAGASGDTIYVLGEVDSYNGQYNETIINLKSIDFVSDGSAEILADNASYALYQNDPLASSYAGFTINANATAADTIQARGGAMTLTNCTITDGSDSTIYVHPDVGTLTVSGCALTTADQETFDILGNDVTVVVSGSTFTISGSGTLFNGDRTGFSYTSSGNTYNFNSSSSIVLFAASGNYSMSGDTFNITTCQSLLRAATVDFGSILFDGNTINVAGNSSDLIDINSGTWDVDITNNSIGVSGWNSNSENIIQVINQVSPVVSGNTINSSAVTNLGKTINISINNNTTTDYGTAEVKNNTIYCRSKDTIIDVSGVYNQDGFIKAEIWGNTVYGPAWTGHSSPVAHDGTTHYGIYSEFLKNQSFLRNYITGIDGHALIVKGGDDEAGGYSQAIGDGIQFNVADNFYKHGVYVKGIDGINVWGNTLIDNATTHDDTDVILYINDGDWGEYSTNCSVKNNIIVSDGAVLVSAQLDNGTGFSSSNNLLYRDGGSQNFGVVGATSYSAWSGGSGWSDTYGTDLNSDPFINSNLSLTETSPCINAGTKAGDVSFTSTQTDYFGNEYFFAPYDRLNIGADQQYSDADDRPTTGGQLIYGTWK